jgi:hypothetical protein
MPSSTSSSEIRVSTHALLVLLGILFLYCSGLEIVTRVGFTRVSRVQSRIRQDLNVAKCIPRRSSDGRPSMLLVGNSLLLEGVERASLKRELAPNYLVALLPIENTQFEDWHFGLRRLFAEGTRPSIVVLCLPTNHLISNTTDGEYFAYYLMQGRDLLALKKESQLDNTTMSGYFFANRSAWLGSRSEIRNWLILKVMPNLVHLIGYFPAKPPLPPAKEELLARIMPHLLKMDILCKANGARLVTVIPPTLSPNDGSADLRASAEGDGLLVLIPLRPKDVTPDDFRDGFHMNPRGARRFTSRLASMLQMLSGDSAKF